jgi:hypothetical protein
LARALPQAGVAAGSGPSVSGALGLAHVMSTTHRQTPPPAGRDPLRPRWALLSAIAVIAALGTVVIAIAYSYGRDRTPRHGSGRPCPVTRPVRRSRVVERSSRPPRGSVHNCRSGGGRYFGAWIDGLHPGGRRPWDLSAESAFEKLSGKDASIGTFGLNMATDTFSAADGDAFRNHGMIPMLTLATSINSTDTLKMVTAGKFDTLLRDHFAKPIAAWGHPIFIRMNWEFNGNWYPWSVGTNGNTAADFVAAWRHVVDLFRANGARNVSWVWCANAYSSGSGLSTTVAQSYPGDAYVDWTAMDGYRKAGSALTFSQVFGAYYDYITKTIAPTKPIMIAEVGTVEQTTGGRTKAQWIDDMFASIPTRFPKLAALIYLDEDNPDGDGANYALNSSAASSQAWRNGIVSSAYRGSVFGVIAASPIAGP